MSAEDSVGPYHPSRPEESIPELPTSIPDPDSEKPAENERLPENLSTSTSDGDLAFPAIVLGCAVFGYGIYFAKDQVLSDTPVRLIRYALRCGINAFDTSPWYHPSEIILGRVFKAIEAEFPRESYTLITKVGKYGPKVQYHTYDAASVKASVERSLKRMNTSYLDAVYLHDVEFVTSHPFPFPKGDHRALLTASATGDDEYRLSPPYEPLGPGDAQILEGLAALKELQKEGKVRKIGIAGFPLPLLLRLSHLAANTPSVGPLDLVQTYGQQTVQNPSLEVYLPEFKKAGVRQIMNAAPLSMGILTTGGGPDWHPVNVAKGPVYDACREASQLCQDQGTSIEEVAVNFAYKGLKDGDRDIPVVIGCKVIDELKRTIKGWRAVNVPGEVSAETRAKIDTVEKQVEELFERKGIKGWSWQSPSPGSL